MNDRQSPKPELSPTASETVLEIPLARLHNLHSILHHQIVGLPHYCDSVGFVEIPQFLDPQPEKDNPLRTAEMTIEDDYGMIDGVINNGRRGEELEKAKEATEKKPSIRERLADAKRECAERPKPEKQHSGRNTPEHGDL